MTSKSHPFVPYIYCLKLPIIYLIDKRRAC